MLGNGQCDKACLTSACQNDKGDCASLACSIGCYPYMLNDGICQSECHTEACGWDGYDCDCSPGCTVALLNNSVCDSLCNNAKCSFDSHMCPIECSPGCLPDMLSNGVCDPVCNVPSCNYDSRQCGCAPKCSFTDLGSCKAECLVPDCNYDAFVGYSQCQSELIRKSAFYYQITIGNFSVSYQFTPSQNCSSLLWSQSLTQCIPNCTAMAYFNSFGNCNLAATDHNCLAYLQGSKQICVNCTERYFNQNGVCVMLCSPGYTPHPLIPTLCYPIPGSDLATVAKVIYVNISSSLREDGSVTHPFSSLANAFFTLAYYNTTVLLFPGIYDIIGTSKVVQKQGDIDTNHYLPIQQITIAAKDCYSGLCDRPTIRYLASLPYYFSFTANVTITNVNFDGNTSRSADCTDPRCYYSFYYETINGIPYDDRGQVIDTRNMPLSRFPTYPAAVLIKMNVHYNISITNVTFANFRQGLQQLIYSVNGRIDLYNVNFINISGEISPILLQKNDIVGFFTYTKGIVELMGNGFEYNVTSSSSIGSFYLGITMQSVHFAFVTFQFNLMRDSLIDITSRTAVTVDSCNFTHNMMRASLIKITEVWPGSQGTINDFPLLAAYQIIISNSIFRNNSADGGSLVTITYQRGVLNALICNTTFTNELSTSQQLISIVSANSISAQNTAWLNQTFIEPNGNRSKLPIPPRQVVIQNVTFSNCHMVLGFLRVSNIAVVYLKDITIQRNTPTSVNYFTNTLLAFTQRPDIYMRLSWANALIQMCIDGIVVTNGFSVYVSMLTVDHIYCASGIAGMHIIGLVGVVNVTDSTFSNMQGNSNSGGVLAFSSEQVTMTRVSIIKCANAANGIISGSDLFSLLIIDSIFLQCQSQSGGVFLISNTVAIIQNCTFRDNSANGNGGVVAILSSTNRVELIISQSVFLNNTGVNGGVLYSDLISGLLTLKISTSQFLENSAVAGNVIYISNVKMSNDSFISTSNFLGNRASDQGVLYFGYQVGILNLFYCVFFNNSAANSALIYGDFQSQLVMRNIIAYQNTGESLISLPDPLRNQELTGWNISFSHNTAISFQLDFATVQCSQCAFSDNTGNVGTVISLASNSTAIFESSNFTNNAAFDRGGVSFISAGSSFTANMCNFLNNSAGTYAGVLYIQTESSATIRLSTFQYNKAALRGSAINMNVHCILTLQDSLVTSNVGQNDGVIVLFSSALSLIRTTVKENQSALNTASIILSVSNLIASNSTFAQQTSRGGSFISLTAGSQASFYLCTFRDGLASDYAGAILLTGSELNITDCLFDDMKSSTGTSIMVVANSQVRIVRTEFIRQFALFNGGIIAVSDSSIVLSDAKLSGYNAGGLVLTHASLVMTNCSFEGNSDVDGSGNLGGALACIGCAHMDISASHFSSLESWAGGSLYLVEVVSGRVSTSLFHSNQAIDSGAVFADNCNITFLGNAFVNNSASLDVLQTGLVQRGGAITVLCTSPGRVCCYSFQSNLFQNNEAVLKGGAICWENSQPAVDVSNVFIGNMAQYGNDIASFAFKLATSNVTHLDGIASGQSTNPILILALRDHYEQVISIDNSSRAEMISSNNGTVISGLSQVTATAGIFIFNKYIISADPNSFTKVNITTTAVLNPNLSDITFNASIRDCIIGESRINNQCVVCPPGKYSLNPKLDCQKCPEGAECLGNSTMLPKPGYWRSGNYSDVFFVCPNPNACLGSTDFSSHTGVCDVGYEGNKCESCSSGYSQFSKRYCAPCPNAYVNGVKIIAFILLLLLLAAIIVKFTIKSATGSKSVLSIHIKILMNYVQLSMLISALNLNWPEMVLQLFEVHDASGSMIDQAISVECLLSSESEINAYFIELLLMSVAPLILSLLSVSVWLIVAVIKGKAGVLRNECVSSAIILFFLIHPSVVRMLFSIFNCEEIDPGEYWVVGKNIRCWEGTHLKYALGLSLPCLIIWGIAIPALCLLSLKLKHTQLQTEQMKVKFGYLFNKYRTDTYYWEFVIIYRKLLIISVTVFLNRISVTIQAICVLDVLLIALVFQYRKKPYSQQRLNELEMRSILVSVVTIYSGFFYYSNELNQALKVFFFLFILGANFYFIYYWLFSTFHVVSRKLVMRVKLLKKLFPKIVAEETERLKAVRASTRPFRSELLFRLYMTQTALGSIKY